MLQTMFILILYLKGSAIEYMGHYDVNGQWKEMGGKILKHQIQDTLVKKEKCI